MKKRIALALGVLMVCTLALFGCGEKAGGNSKTPVSVADVTGETIDAGRVSALCPDGWESFGMPDLFSDDKDAMVTNILVFRKGAKSDEDYSNPGIKISYYGENETFYKLNKDDYGESEDLEPIELGGRTWEGFTGLDSGQKYVWLWTGTSDSNEEFLINFLCEYDGVTISLDDVDVQAIIASIDIN